MPNLLDVIMFSIISAAVLIGLYKGGVRVVIGNSSFLFSMWLGTSLFPAINSLLHKYIGSGVTLSVCSFCLSFVASFIICSILAGRLRALLAPICGGIIDRSLGLAIGMLSGIFVSMALFFTIVILSGSGGSYGSSSNLLEAISNMEKENHHKWFKESVSFSFFSSLANHALKSKYISTFLETMYLSFGATEGESSKSKNLNADDELKALLDKAINSKQQ